MHNITNLSNFSILHKCAWRTAHISAFASCCRHSGNMLKTIINKQAYSQDNHAKCHGRYFFWFSEVDFFIIQYFSIHLTLMYSRISILLSVPPIVFTSCFHCINSWFSRVTLPKAILIYFLSPLPFPLGCLKESLHAEKLFL